MVDFYLVGGAVRDRLLGLEIGERDWVVVGATPGELEALGFKRLDTDFPVFSHPRTGEECALARREKKTGAGYKGFSVDFGPDVTLEEDLRRRDLRVNAIAQTETGELIDPFDGQGDLTARTLRHVSPAFVEDPLRVLRAARFAAEFESLGFSIHPSTRELMRAMSGASEMNALSAGRVWKETEKALAAKNPTRYFFELEACGALETLLPELIPTESAPSADSGSRLGYLAALEAVAKLDPRPEIRLATLIAALVREPGQANGNDIVERLGRRFPIPRKHTDLARVACALTSIAPANLMRAPALHEALEDSDAFRRSKRFGDALLVCRALEDAVAEASNHRAAVLKRAFDAAREIDAAEISRAGLEGKQVAEELGRRRVQAIEASLAAFEKK